MNELKSSLFLQWFAQLNPWVQVAFVLSTVALIVLIIINPAAGVGVTALSGLLLTIKALFGSNEEPSSGPPIK